MSSKILVTQDVPGSGLALLEGACQVDVFGGPVSVASMSAQQLAQYAGLFCMLTDRVDSDLIDAMPKLEFVSSVSVGVDHVDIAALDARGIPLGHTPGVLVETTADTAFALLLAAARRVAEADRFIREGNWRPDNRWSPDFFVGKEVAGSTLGILGLGEIGQAMAKRAHGFGMRVLSWTRSGREVQGVEPVSLETLLAQSDFLSVHVALTEQTMGLLNAERIAAMKPGAVLVNTARGGVVDEAAVAAALDRGHLWAAGIDVFEREPLPVDHALLSHPRVVVTPHIGSATTRTRAAMVELAVANALAGLAGRPMPHCVNPQVYS